MVQGQETSVLKAQSHMDTGETKAEPAVLDLAALHAQVGARPSSRSLCHGTRCAGQATASARKSQSTRVHGHKNGTWNLMFLDEHPQISVKSPYPSPNQTEDFAIPQARDRILHPGTGNHPYLYLLLLKAAACHLVPLQCHPFTWLLEPTSTTWNTAVCTGPNSSARGHEWRIHTLINVCETSTELLHRICLLLLQLGVSKKTKQTELCCFSQKDILWVMGLTISVIMPLSTVWFNLNF